MRVSSYGRTAVASPSSVWSRQTKPRLCSARALISGRRATNSAMTGSVVSPRARAMLTWASWNLVSVTCCSSVLSEWARLEREPGALEIVNKLNAGGLAHASRSDQDGRSSRHDHDNLCAADDIEKDDKRAGQGANQERDRPCALAGELEGTQPHNGRQNQKDRVRVRADAARGHLFQGNADELTGALIE